MSRISASRFVNTAIAALACAGLASCQGGALLPESGHFQGNRVALDGSQRLVAAPVAAEVSPLEHGEATVSVTPLSGDARSVVEFSDVSSDRIRVSIPEVSPTPLLLQRQGDCYAASGELSARVCTARQEVVIEVSGRDGHGIYSLTLDEFPVAPPPQLETPRAYGLDEAVDRAFRMDFATRIEFQRVMQAHHLARNAYLNLLPHLSANSILALISSPNVMGLLAAVGDLAPFLLPTRWMQAREAALASEAEQDAVILMRGDAGLQLESLAYTFARDRGAQKDYQAAIAQVEQVHRQLEDAEAAGRFPDGSADSIASLLQQLRQEAEDLELSVKVQRTFIAQAMGFMNPQAVSGLEVPAEEIPIEQASDVDGGEIMRDAAQRSFELRQMDYLIHAAEIGRNATFFSWLDPSGDPSAELGPGLGEAVAFESSRVDELRATRDQVQAVLLQNAQNAATEYNEAMEDHGLSVEGFGLQDARLAKLLGSLQAGRLVDTYDLVDSLRQRLAAKIDLSTTETAFRIARAKLDRLLLRARYSHLSYLPAEHEAP